jgi:PST family polysaccharide transporter
MGSGSIANIAIGIVSVKVLAVLLGPAGVGLMGLYQSIMGTASTLAGCGMQTSGVRQIAISQGDPKLLGLVRRTLLLGNLLLGGIGMGLLWFFREPVALLVFKDAVYSSQVGWLGVGVFMSLLAASQIATLQGMRRIGDVARVNVLGALFGALVGILFVWSLGLAGLQWFVVAAPAGSLIFSSWYAKRLPQVETGQSVAELSRQWRSMMRFGVPVMAAALLTVVTQLIVRSLVVRDLGLDASGYFQAAWAISMTYIGFVLSAMGADYLPRLTEEIHDRERAKSLVNEQTEMALLMAGPILLAMLTLAPWIIELLYAKGFLPAAEILRWQVMGDIFKIAGWPMGFIVLAMGRGDLFIATQFNWNAIYLLSLWLGLDRFGLAALGLGFFVAYVIQVVVVRLVVGRIAGFKSEAGNLKYFGVLLVTASLVLSTSYHAPQWTLLFGGALTVLLGTHSAWRLKQLLR